MNNTTKKPSRTVRRWAEKMLKGSSWNCFHKETKDHFWEMVVNKLGNEER